MGWQITLIAIPGVGRRTASVRPVEEWLQTQATQRGCPNESGRSRARRPKGPLAEGAWASQM